MRHLCLPLSLILLAACKDGGDDSGDTDDTNTGPGGCFTINDAGGWPDLPSALGAAADGDTIALCEEITQDISVDKSVTLVGNGTVWTAPSNKHALTIENGATVTVEGVTFSSTRSAIQVELDEAGPATVTVRDCVFGSEEHGTVDNYGIENVGGTLVVEGSTFYQAGWGALISTGGSVTVSGSTFDGNVDFGILLEDGAIGTITGNTFSFTVPSDDDLENGWGVKAEDSTANLSGNTFSLNQYGDVRVSGGLSMLTMNGDTSDSSLIGIWLDAASASLTDVTITNYVQYGLVDESGATLDAVNPTFTTTHEGSAPATGAELGDFSGSFGMVLLGPDTTITGGVFSGNNGGAIWQNPGNDTEPAVLSISNTTITDNHRYGVLGYTVDATFTDVTVTDTIDDDATCCDENGSCWCNMAVAMFLSDIAWNGGALGGNGTFGLTTLSGAAEVSGVTFSDNETYGIYMQDSALVCDTCTFDQGRQYQIYLYQAGALITNSAFSNGSYTSEYEWTDTETGDVYTSISHYQAQDIFAYSSTLEISNTTFSNGESGIMSMLSEPTTIIDSTFDGYNTQPVYAYDSTLEVSRTDFLNTGSEPVYCYAADVTLDKVRIQGVTEYEYWYESWLNGELDYEYTSVSPGSAMYASSCTVSLEDVSISETYSRGLYLWDTALEMDGVTLSTIGTQGYSWDAAIYAYYSSTAPDMVLNDVSIGDVQNGYGIYLVGSTTVAGGYVEMVGLNVGSADGSGTASAGVYMSSVERATLSSFDIQNTGSDGVYLTSTTATLADGVITNAAGYGVWSNASTLDISNVTVTNAAQSGFYLGGGTHTVNGSTVTGADRYGIECAAATFDGCATNTLDGAMGETYDCGCDAAGDTDTGTP
jgi:parallel beta-helix repeat protein